MRHHVYALKQAKHPQRPYVLDLQSNLLVDLGCSAGRASIRPKSSTN